MRQVITKYYPDCVAFYRLDLPNGYYYVGSTNLLTRRLRRHRLELENGEHHNPLLKEHFTKWDDIKVTYIEFQVIEMAKDYEQGFIDANYHDPLCCNVGTDVDKLWGGALGMPQSVRDKISAGHKGRKHTPEQIEQQRLCQLGKKHSSEHKAKISASLKGKTVSDETRQRLSLALKGKGVGRVASEETKAKLKARFKDGDVTLSQETKDKIAAANFKKVSVDGVIYNSITDAANAFGIKMETASWRFRSASKNFATWIIL